MKQLLSVLIVAMAIAGSVYAQHTPGIQQPQPAPKTEAPLTPAEKEVRKLEREWLDAYEKLDADAMERILADDFKLTLSKGQSQTKSDILAQLKSVRDLG